MASPGSEGSLVRYFCTAGKGMEPFLIDEVKRKLAAEDVCHIPGKVLFSSSATIDRVIGLKSAERLFILLKQHSPFKFSAQTSQAKAASMLQSRLLEDRNQWSSAVMTWSRLQGEMAATTNTTIQHPSSPLGATGRSEAGEKCLVESRKRPCEHKEEESRDYTVKNQQQNGIKAHGKKMKMDVEDATFDLSGERNGEKVDPTIDRRREKDADAGMDVELSNYRSDTNVQRTSGSVSELTTLEHNVESSSRTAASESMETVSFRISCKCSGSLSRCFTTQEVSKMMAAGLSRLLGWKADLKNPLLEVNVHLSDDYCLLGIPLTRLPLANRSYIQTTGLRSTVAWAMASLAQIQPGFCVVDPMCGVGTILIEAAEEHKDTCFLGLDIDDGQLQRATENIAFARRGTRIQLLKASCMELPLPSSSVEAVVCDLPFGRKFGTKINMAANLPAILSEMERVLCIGGTLVVLLSPQLSCHLKKLLIQNHSGSTSDQGVGRQAVKPNRSHSDVPSEQQAVNVCPEVEFSPAELQNSPPARLTSLKHQMTVRLGLGAIDGLLHKYVKTHI
ncbi:THUMP domain-containing protein 2 [Cololabis saira]|uniref:THUMP domain-containing protein 2 n=1 Tax=Cololabis saira TaxID=129043 RepID=UPI002AD24BAA|nr:THUMP domain-containing protein 2 [Cololabis saira]